VYNASLLENDCQLEKGEEADMFSHTYITFQMNFPKCDSCATKHTCALSYGPWVYSRCL